MSFPWRPSLSVRKFHFHRCYYCLITAGVMDRDYCGCNVCVEGTRKLGEQCGDVLGPGGKCDARERLLCSYPQDQSIMTGVCIEGIALLTRF